MRDVEREGVRETGLPWLADLTEVLVWEVVRVDSDTLHMLPYTAGGRWR